MRQSFLMFIIFFAELGWAQPYPREEASNQIDTIELSSIVHLLASRDMEGRKTGSIGQQKAASYIENQFKTIGLTPVFGGGNSYKQEFTLIKSSPSINQLEINGQTMENRVDYLFEGELDMNTPKTLKLVVIPDIGSFKEIRLEGKSVAFIQHTDPIKNLQFQKMLRQLGAEMIIQLIDFKSIAEFQNEFQTSGERLAYLKLEERKKEPVQFHYMTKDRFMKVTEISGDQLVEKQLETEMMVNFQVKRNKIPISTANIVGVLPGETEETVIISAHYDHEGMQNGILYPGADDNASGVAALLEIAQAFKKAWHAGVRFKKSILFVAFSAEEDGLLGSEYFVRNLPFPINKVMVNLNVDMIGRVSPEYADFENYIYLIGSKRLSNQLFNISENINDTYLDLFLDYSYDEPNQPDQLFQRSDHWHFAKNDIPVIFYFGGIHDDYHEPTDTPDKINYEILMARVRLIFQTAWELACMDNMLKLDID